MNKVKDLYKICGGGYLRCTDVSALLKTPEAKRQLAAVGRIAKELGMTFEKPKVRRR